jgi:hypothetical protein
MPGQKKVLDLVHEIRNHLHKVQGLAHFHMSSDHRYTVESELDEVARKVGEIWSWCLSCSECEEEEDDAPNDL